MTATVERPPHIDPRRWYDPRVSWRARQQASDDWKRTQRPKDVTYEVIDGRRQVAHTTDQLLDTIPPLLEQGMAATDIADELGMSPAAIERRFRQIGRNDLALPFGQARTERRMKPCGECGVPTHTGRCRSCAMRAVRLQTRSQESS